MTGSSSFTRFDSNVAIKYSDVASDILGSDYFYTAEPFIYHIDCYPSNKIVKVPEGFLSDGASIPRVFWFWASPIGRHAQAAILHDYLCEYLTILEDGKPVEITRKEADQIFKESLLVLGVSNSKANIMYAGVSAYRLVANVTEPSFNPEKYRLEEEIRRVMKEGGKSKLTGDGIIRINMRKKQPV